MAIDTDRSLQTQVIYSVYVRAHTPEGTFRAVIPDLDRIRSLGTDIIWFMPIHSIGVVGKKGSLGCPYANRDYRDVNPAYGTMEDFKALVDEIHARGMKVMIDVVYNHTSPDSVLYKTHPEFFFHGPDGKPGNRYGDWADVIDLDYSVPELWDYQIESLRFWAGIVDGFRCDVASLVPLDFWKKARTAVKQINPGCIWLAESVHLSFACKARRLGFHAMRDSEGFETFDMEYDYDIREVFDKLLNDRCPLSHWTDMLNFQEGEYPDNYNKMRCLENHDQPRIASLVPDMEALVNWTAMLYFLKGTTLIYAGQEWADAHLPSLFEKETINRETGCSLMPLMKKLARAKKELFTGEDSFWATADDHHHIAVMERENSERHCVGVFSLKAKCAKVAVPLPDGEYLDHIGSNMVAVKGGSVYCGGTPLLLDEIK
ncbi:MAG: alpha-amylase [Oscillospiraceae bacterium]|nr:alpha-amylase [Oscillospiraceae bacterium]